jgi:lipoyl-dependent peroxiredoxin
MPTRTGSAQWRGDLMGGEGDLTVGEGVFSGRYTFKSRFEEGEGTNPEELIAAAHAACYSMALANILAQHEHAPESVRTTARVLMGTVDDEPGRIRRIELRTEARVPGIDDAHFQEHVEEARVGCPISRALAAVPEIAVEATLD